MNIDNFDPKRALTSMAQDITAIVTLYGDLHAEAEARGSHREIPGGDAMVHLGPAASMAAWHARFNQAEAAGEDVRYANDQVAERHVLLVLGDWSEQVRAEQGVPTSLRVTVERAADYLRDALPWIVEHFNDAPFMAAELRACRAALEGLLRDGVRHDREATACLRDVPTEDGDVMPCGGQLERRVLDRRDCTHVRAAINSAKGVLEAATVLRRLLIEFPEMEVEHRSCDQGGRDDVYRCGRCGALYAEAEYWLAVKQNYERRAG